MASTNTEDSFLDDNKKIKLAWTTEKVTEIIKTDLQKVDFDVNTKPVHTGNVICEIKEQIRDFSESTSFHGIKNVFGKEKTLTQRLFWVVLIVGCMTIVCIDVSTKIKYYISAPSSVNLDMKYENSMEFPAITICNQNAFRRTLAVQNGHFCTLETLYGSRSCPTNMSIPNVTLHDLYEKDAHMINDLVYSCKFKGQTCTADNFTSIMTDFGLCYTFNGRDTPPQTIYAPGIHNGLELVINAEQYDYMIGPRSSVGIKVLVHDKDKFPMPEEYGYDLPTGKHIFMKMKVLKEKRLPPPHGKCDRKHQPIFGKYSYSRAACYLECKNKFLEQSCGCRYMFVPEMEGTSRLCTAMDFDCMDAASETFVRQETQSCSCHLPCDIQYYLGYLSYGSLSEFALKSLEEDEVLRQDLLSAREVAFTFESKYQQVLSIYEHVLHLLNPDNEQGMGVISVLIWKFYHLLWFFNQSLYDIKQIYQVNNDPDKTQDLAVETATRYNEMIDDAIYRVLNLSIQLSGAESNEEPLPLTTYKGDIDALSSNLGEIEKIQNSIFDPWVEECRHGLEMRKTDIGRFFSFGSSGVCLNKESAKNNETSILQSSMKEADDIMQNITSSMDDLNNLQRIINQTEQYLVSSQNTSSDSLISNITETVGLQYDLLQYTMERVELFQILTQDDCNADEYMLYANVLMQHIADLFEELHSYFSNGTSFIKISEYATEEKSEEIRNLKYFADELYNKNRRCVSYMTLSLNLLMQLSNISFLQANDAHTEEARATLIRASDFLQALDDFRFDEVGDKTTRSFVDLTPIASAFKFSATINSAYVRNNFLRVNLFFNELSVQEVTQQEVYDIFALLGSIGGALGLFVGASVMSICEVGEIAIKVLKRCILHKSRKRDENIEE